MKPDVIHPLPDARTFVALKAEPFPEPPFTERRFSFHITGTHFSF